MVEDTEENRHDRDVYVYESASGLGLNLLLTAEILYETIATQQQQQPPEQVPTRVHLSGNDYVNESVRLARVLLKDDTVLSHTGGIAEYDRICRGDSTQLHSWVPAAAFDIVFTGFITPLEDPLQFKDLVSGEEEEELRDAYARLCHEASKEGGDSDEQRRVHLLQQRQNDWYATWVKEMLRLAKPGAVVGVEMITYPLCEDLDEGGGLDHNFWRRGVREDWDVDPASLVIWEAHSMPGRRYHVLMRKRSA